MVTETGVAGSKANHRSPDDELDTFIDRRTNERLCEEGPYDPEAEWKSLEAEYAQDRRETVAVLWARYHWRQADRLRASLGELVRYHETQAARWEGE
jgi:hypothetical protein